MMSHRVLGIFVLIASFYASSSVFANEHNKERSILVSIAPLHSIVTSITQGVLVPELLMNADVSPHDFQLKPSQRRKIGQASLFVWVGDSLETILDKVVHIEGLELFGIEQYGEQLNLLPIREDEVFGDEDHDHHDHAGAVYDPHFWMSPDNALRFASALTQHLMSWDPVNANAYQHNYVNYLAQMKTKMTVWKDLLKPLEGQRVVSAHDGFQYFESDYGFHHVASVQTNTEVALSIKRIDTLNELIKSQQVSCMFSEPQVPDRMIQALVRRNSLKLATLDILGGGFLPGNELYFNLMDNNVQAIVDCYRAAN